MQEMFSMPDDLTVCSRMLKYKFSNRCVKGQFDIGLKSVKC